MNKPPGPHDSGNGMWNRFDKAFGDEQLGKRKAKKERKRIERKKAKRDKRRGKGK